MLADAKISRQFLYCDSLSLYLRDGIEVFDGKWEVNFNGLLNRY